MSRPVVAFTRSTCSTKQVSGDVNERVVHEMLAPNPTRREPTVYTLFLFLSSGSVHDVGVTTIPKGTKSQVPCPELLHPAKTKGVTLVDCQKKHSKANLQHSKTTQKCLRFIVVVLFQLFL